MSGVVDPLLADLVHDALIVCDLQGTIVQWNRAAALRYEYADCEAIGWNIEALLSRVFLGDSVEDSLTRSGAWEGDVRVRSRDGRFLLGPCRVRLSGGYRIESHGPMNFDTDANLRLVIDNMPGLVSYVDSKLRYRFANHVYTDWFGTAADRIVGSHVEQVLGPEAFRRVEPYMRRALSGELTRFEHFLPFGRGVGKFASVTYAPDRDPQTGEVRGFVVLVEDISARHQAEQAQRSSEALYREIVETAHEGIWIVGLQTQTLFANYRMAELLQTTVEEMARGSFRRYMFDEDHKVADELFRQKVQGDRQPFEFRLKRADGKAIWVRISGVPLTTSEGEVTGLLGMFTDITAARAAEQALRDREEHLRKLLANLPDIVARFDPQLRFLYVSPAVETATGAAPDVFLGRTHAEAGVPPDLAEYLERRLSEIFQSGKSATVDFEMMSPAGARRLYHGLGVPEFSDDHKVASVLTIVHDVTEARRIEEALRKTNSELEQFAYAAAHDLQEPLRVIGIYTELFLRRYASSELGAQQAAGYILSAVRRMEALIGDLLTYSKVVHEEGFSLALLCLDDALDDAIHSLGGMEGDAAVELQRERLPVVMGERTQLAQVFQNLLSNAYKYRSRTEMPRIFVSAAQEGAEWIISVEDNGIGFSPNYAEQIFGLFKRLHRDEYPGTGVGLGICRRIVERHGGRIWAESKGEGFGATFRFTLLASE